jgi:ribonuclease VapC
MDADWELTRGAAKIKAKGKIAYADCFAAALAKKQNAELITGDPEFEQLSGQIKIRWLPQK